MKAMVFEDKFHAVVREVARPAVKGDQALVRILACGICGGDLHFYEGTHPYSHYPQINGHEIVGVAEELPEGTEGVAVGDRVVAEILFPCGACYPCRHGKPNCCSNLNVFGIHVPGGFAEYAAVPVKNLHKVPEELTVEQAVLTEPYSIGHHVVERSGILPGDTALVLGVGTIGLTVVDILKARGVLVIAADLSEYRLQKACALGADIAIHSGNQDVMEQVMRHTNGEGAGVVFEVTGVPKVMEMTVDLTAAGGTIVIVGLTKEKVLFPGVDLTRKELTIRGSRNAFHDFEPVLELMRSGMLHPDQLLTKKIRIDDAAEEFERLYRDAAREVKAAILF